MGVGAVAGCGVLVCQLLQDGVRLWMPLNHGKGRGEREKEEGHEEGAERDGACARNTSVAARVQPSPTSPASSPLPPFPPLRPARLSPPSHPHLQVLACLPPTPWSISDEEVGRRRDFRHQRVFSIDPPTARDLDDALSGGWVGC